MRGIVSNIYGRRATSIKHMRELLAHSAATIEAVCRRQNLRGPRQDAAKSLSALHRDGDSTAPRPPIPAFKKASAFLADLGIMVRTLVNGAVAAVTTAQSRMPNQSIRPKLEKPHEPDTINGRAAPLPTNRCAVIESWRGELILDRTKLV